MMLAALPAVALAQSTGTTSTPRIEHAQDRQSKPDDADASQRRQEGHGGDITMAAPGYWASLGPRVPYTKFG